MKLIIYLFLFGIFLSCKMTSKDVVKAETLTPNVIIIFTDDQGYGDISSFGSKIVNTPNIDALGTGGATLTDFLVASSTCSPSRAALLTGSYR